MSHTVGSPVSQSGISSDCGQPVIFGDNHYMSNSFCFREKKNNESIAKSILLLPLYKDYSTARTMLSTRYGYLLGKTKRRVSTTMTDSHTSIKFTYVTGCYEVYCWCYSCSFPVKQQLVLSWLSALCPCACLATQCRRRWVEDKQEVESFMPASMVARTDNIGEGLMICVRLWRRKNPRIFRSISNYIALQLSPFSFLNYYCNKIGNQYKFVKRLRTLQSFQNVF